ncbi:MAG TPA: hypothetical protein VII00_08360 [bacterium]
MKQTVDCPLCDAEIYLEVNEVEGDTIYCGYCESPLKIAKNDKNELVAKEIDEF